MGTAATPIGNCPNCGRTRYSGLTHLCTTTAISAGLPLTTLMVPRCAHGWQTPRFRSLDSRRGAKSVVPVHGSSQLASVVGVHGNLNYAGEQELRKRAMDIDWMSNYELTQAIPPAYTEVIGHQLLQHVRARAAA